MMGAVLESSGAVAKRVPPTPPGYEESHPEEDQDRSYSSYVDPNTVQLRVGNSLGAGGSGMQGLGASGRQISPGMGMVGYGYRPDGAHRIENEGTYEPLFLGSNEASPSTPTGGQPQAPNTGLMRRRSEHRRSGRREQNRRSASVGPSIAPKQQQVIKVPL